MKLDRNQISIVTMTIIASFGISKFAFADDQHLKGKEQHHENQLENREQHHEFQLDNRAEHHKNEIENKELHHKNEIENRELHHKNEIENREVHHELHIDHVRHEEWDHFHRHYYNGHWERWDDSSGWIVVEEEPVTVLKCSPEGIEASADTTSRVLNGMKADPLLANADAFWTAVDKTSGMRSYERAKAFMSMMGINIGNRSEVNNFIYAREYSMYSNRLQNTFNLSSAQADKIVTEVVKSLRPDLDD